MMTDDAFPAFVLSEKDASHDRESRVLQTRVHTHTRTHVIAEPLQPLVVCGMCTCVFRLMTETFRETFRGRSLPRDTHISPRSGEERVCFSRDARVVREERTFLRVHV